MGVLIAFASLCLLLLQEFSQAPKNRRKLWAGLRSLYPACCCYHP
uniref:Uncharacterized protein n=1 Tax=Rhizophora mucronata TaxID=61149 RepID=A0A2P2P4V3_RHIMU